MYSGIIAFLVISSLLPCKFQTYGTSSSQDFTFANPQAFLRVEPEWPLAATREVTFHFRTERPHGLLLYHGLTEQQKDQPHYEMYLMLEKARLKVIHVFHKDGLSNSYFVGKGLNRDKWHEVRLIITPATGELVVSVDKISINETLPSLKENPNYNLEDDATVSSFLYFGGTDTYDPALNLQYNYVRFIGCIGDIKFGHSEGAMQNVPVQSYSQIEEGCIDRCEDEDRCLHHGKCINHYEFTSCDCFGTGHEGVICGNDSVTTVTLRGYSYFTYRIYYWRDRVQSEANMFSILFKTYVQDSVLLYGAGEHHDNYIAITIFGGELYFEINFGDGPLNTTLGYSLHDEIWHNLTMIHHGRIVKVILDNKHSAKLEATGKHHHLHLDPEVYIGSAPSNAKGLKSNKKFVGCLKDIYINKENVLYSLHDGDSSSVRHYGVFLVEYGCSVVDIIPITFRLPESRLLLTHDHNSSLHLALEFKTSQRESLLASGDMLVGNETGFWQIYLARGTAFFEIWTNSSKPENKWMISEGTHLSNDDWHQVQVIFNNGKVDLIIDFIPAASGEFNEDVQFFGEVYIGDSLQNVIKGFVGCMRDIFMNKQWIDPRDIVGTERAKGKVSLDNCQLVNPCNNPQACEHGGKCFVENGDTRCNCDGTGYTGKTCHFSIYKRTCEELYLVGHRSSTIYKTDIDRNGPLPPANVECDMDEEGYIVTRVETNMPSEMVVRKKGMENFYFDITYKDFTPPMLQALIMHSKQCTQPIKYECFKMPLGLRTYTWMESSAGEQYVTNIGSNIVSGRCPCSQRQDCANASLFCNCDSRDARWRTDESTFTDPKELGITRVYVLQPKDVASDAEARLSIGPLECVETDTQQFVITFKTPVSSVEVPGWYRGDMAFSFRTSNSKAVLVYQAAVHSQHGYFRVLLIDDYWLSFEFTVNGNPQTIKVHSRRKLNSGEWQQVWVDHDTHHMRFTVNLDSEMIDLGEEEEAGPFEGPLYVGGVPKHYAGNSTIKEGFIGCFRGLIIGEEVVNLHEHLIKSSPDIVVNCQPSCSPNPCKNDAKCLEYWGSYECECVNPVAHSGKNCENNINTNGMTFLTSNSFYHNSTESVEVFPMNPILGEDILLNFRTYEESALLLYANDHLHNFVQLHFKEQHVLFTFNSNRSLAQGSVKVPGISQGQPIQIKVSREEEKTTLYVNNEKTVIPKPMKFIKTYHQEPWLEGKDLETVKPPRGIYPSVPHTAMFLGSVGLGTVSYLPGFVGCMRGLKIANLIFNLDEAALVSSSLKGQVRAGCTMICDQKPCFNGGICIENWKTNTTSCDCLLTSYTGRFCEQDIGGSFDGKSMVTYPFNLAPTAPDTVLVRLSFSTSGDDIGNRMAILFVQIYQSTRYIFVALTTEGSLLIEENRGDIGAIQSVVTRSSGSFTDKRRHWIYYKRNANEVKVIVNGKEYKYVNKEADVTEDMLFDTSTAVVGGTLTKRHKFGNYGNFHGCISSVAIDLGGLKMSPLDTTFGYTKGALDKVKAENTPTEAKCIGFIDAKEDPFQEKTTSPHTHVPLPSPVPKKYEVPPIKSMASTLFDTMKTSIHVAVVMSIFLGFVLFCLLLYIWKLQKEYKRRQLREEMIFFQGRRSTQSKAMNFTSPERYIEIPSDARPVVTPEADENVKTQNDESKVIQNSEKQPLLSDNDSVVEIQDPVENVQNEEVPASSELSLRPSSSQELEWDPAADNADLITTAMNEMNPNEVDDDEVVLEENENLGPLRSQILRNAPLASASEVTINRLSQTFT